jgi:all-trans-8'-apo-beta-carotenal 15,15'-oxygenase
MENIAIRNAVEFPLTKLKTTFGKIPESICGSYFRNGSSTLKLGQNVLSHWFYGNGALLKV